MLLWSVVLGLKGAGLIKGALLDRTKSMEEGAGASVVYIYIYIERVRRSECG